MRPFALSVIVSCTAATATAQVLEPARRVDTDTAVRARRSADPTQTDVTLDLSGLAGYGDDFWGNALRRFDPNASTVYTGQGAAVLRATHGRARRSIGVRATTLIDTNNRRAEPVTGGGVGFNGVTAVDRTTTLRGSASILYQPFLTITALGDSGAAGGGIPLPTTYGFLESEAWITEASSALVRDWTSALQSSVSYTYFERNQRRDGLDGTSHTVAASTLASVSRSVSVTGDYRLIRQDFVGATNTPRPLTGHTATGGIAVSKRIARNRSLLLSLSGGAGRVEAFDFVATQSFSTWMPVGAAGVGIDLSRSWTIRADYARAPTMLAAVSGQTFANDTLTLNLSGRVNRRLDVVVSANASRGDGQGLVSDGTARYITGSATGQLRWSFSDRLSMVGSVSHYRHDIEGLADLPGQVPALFARNVARVGFSLGLPLVRRGFPRTTNRGSGA